MGHIYLATYFPTLNYGGIGSQPLRFASVLRNHLKGKGVNDEEAGRYRALIRRHNAVPLIHHGQIVPSWAVLDFYKLCDMNAANRDKIVRADRQTEARELTKEIALYRKERTPGYERGLAAAEERRDLLLRTSLADHEIPKLEDVLRELRLSRSVECTKVCQERRICDSSCAGRTAA